jgi:hypothetical protein
MKHRIVTLSLEAETVAHIDRVRGDVARSRYVERLIESAFEKRTPGAGPAAPGLEGDTPGANQEGSS